MQGDININQGDVEPEIMRVLGIQRNQYTRLLRGGMLARKHAPFRQLYIEIIARPSVSGAVGHTWTASSPSSFSSKFLGESCY